MAHYNRLSEVVYDEKLTCWRFRVKTLRIPFLFLYYRQTKMEMTIYDVYGDRLTSTSDMQVHIIDPLNNRLYFDFKSIYEIPHIRNKDINYPIDIMGVVFNTEAHFDNP
ncbi:unnamed protein product [Brassica rapa]|uniref:DUF223 domain-containing protein n=2 Tax=Brassica campestris TaxID=3711 RepID=A0A8D9HIS5_BRACM|nr:unnamed protein product [Brassica rapa]